MFVIKPRRPRTNEPLVRPPSATHFLQNLAYDRADRTVERA